MYDQSALIALVRKLALQVGDFTLASGKKSKYYLDCRKVTLDSAGANLIADGMLELLNERLPDAVGGMAIGADPITAAIITVAGRTGKQLKGFIVRKEAKQHGTGRDLAHHLGVVVHVQVRGERQPRMGTLRHGDKDMKFLPGVQEARYDRELMRRTGSALWAFVAAASSFG